MSQPISADGAAPIIPSHTAALHEFVDAVNMTGGALRFKNGAVSPAGDPGWSDLGDCYIKACQALSLPPMIEESDYESTEDAEADPSFG